MRRSALLISVLALVLAYPSSAGAVPGDLLGTVTLPGNGGCSVGGTFDGTYYITVNTSGCSGTTLGIYEPPAGGGGAAALVATKSVVDGGGDPVTISAVAWDPGRDLLWAGHNAGTGTVHLVDIGDPTVSGPATASFQFAPGVGGIDLLDGLAYDGSDDSLYYTPDISCDVYHFSPTGTLLNTVTPTNAAGEADCQISGVVVGSANTLYIGRDGAAEIRRVDKTTGSFVSQFATTSGRVEDLTCDPVTYAPKEAVLAKDAFNELYEAFEVEEGTCPLPRPPEPPVITLDPPESTNEVLDDHVVTATVTQAGDPLAGVTVTFEVTSGPNAGEVSDPGECSPNADCTTDAAGQVSWTYTGDGGLGIDAIQACFTHEGEEVCADAVKRWVDTTPPEAACEETTNPHGKTTPPAGQKSPGQNEDGFYVLHADDAFDPDPQIFVVDTGSGHVFGPFPDGTKIKYTQAPGAQPKQRKMGSTNGRAGAVDWHLTGSGDAEVFAVDGSGNESERISCKVPPPPK